MRGVSEFLAPPRPRKKPKPCHWWTPWRHQWFYTKHYGTVRCEVCGKEDFIL